MFIDTESTVDKEALREYVLQRLEKFEARASQLVAGGGNFWEQLHNHIASQEEEQKTEAFKVEAQIKELPAFISGWIQNSVETSERFEFFISTKAEEIQSGDQKHDYFWAMQIRHDQLIALLKVLETLLKHIKAWTLLEPEKVVEDSVFQGLKEYSIEDQIYLEAENIHRQRKDML